MLTYVAGFCLYNKYNYLWNFLNRILRKVRILLVENSFNLATIGKDG